MGTGQGEIDLRDHKRVSTAEVAEVFAGRRVCIPRRPLRGPLRSSAVKYFLTFGEPR